MNRARKLSLAVAILVVGVVLAWPFQRGEEFLPTPPGFQPTGEERPSQEQDLLAAEVPDASDGLGALTATSEAIPVRMASSQVEPPAALDPEQHSLTGQMGVEIEDSVTDKPPAATTDSRPAYATIDRQAPFQPGNSWPTEQRHLIRNGDTLERLAKRYLNDEGRALEIFEMNRDLLDNPHLLPIGVELRIPVEPGRIID